MTKVKALNRDGKITWCAAKNPGTGTCNHVFHKIENISDEEFQQQVDRYNEKMNRLLYSNNIGDRVLCAGQGYGLDILEKDPDYHVRREVAQQGHNPALFAIDYDYFTRSVAQDYIDKEKDEKLKKKYQEQLDSYIHGTTAQKLACINAGIGLDEFVNDKDENIRREVAQYSDRECDLDILANDEDWFVRYLVAQKGIDKYLDKLRTDEDYHVRAAVASFHRPQDVKYFINDENSYVKEQIIEAGTDEVLDKLRNDESRDVRLLVAKNGRDEDLDILIYDEDEFVRARVADNGRDKDLDILVDDNSDAVREAVAHFGRDKDLDKLRYAKEDRVRIFVAAKGRPQDRDLFLKDPSWVARKTYVENCRNIEDVKPFLNDEDITVREEAEMTLSI